MKNNSNFFFFFSFKYDMTMFSHPVINYPARCRIRMSQFRKAKYGVLLYTKYILFCLVCMCWEIFFFCYPVIPCMDILLLCRHLRSEIFMRIPCINIVLFCMAVIFERALNTMHV